MSCFNFNSRYNNLRVKCCRLLYPEDTLRVSLALTRLPPRKWLCLEVLIHLPQPDECPRRGEGTTHRLRVTRELVGQHGLERRDHAPASAQLAELVSVMGAKRCFPVDEELPHLLRW